MRPVRRAHPPGPPDAWFDRPRVDAQSGVARAPIRTPRWRCTPWRLPSQVRRTATPGRTSTAGR